jgi:hypothetical protein
LLEASVRLRIEDSDGFSYGSGTIIDTRQGEALVLTCGHVFRDSQGKGKILVDVFGPQPAQKLEGHLVSYDLKRDVGLVSFRPGVPVTVALVAPPGHRLLPGDKVISIGCDHGAPPSVRETKVTSLNKFSKPDNVEVAGQPVQGRSGGGLFDIEGYVVGVCNAADPTDKEGLYAAAPTIQEELEHAHLGAVYRTPQTAAAGNGPTSGNPAGGSGAANSLAGLGARLASGGLTADELRQAATMEQLAASGALSQVAAGQAEVICIVRPLNDPKAKSEVVVLDRASPAFLQQLASERSTQGLGKLTTQVRRPPGPSCRLDQPTSSSAVR